ncbi:hypothetical protein CDO73_11900, partial [Saccharibacillus sp. O23]|uniref:helix-turn-helix transcriptional regulator n=1 Tax=Saccharibacillus sp. O23 TaxID=2009338 RepID=UPI000B72EADB
ARRRLAERLKRALAPDAPGAAALGWERAYGLPPATSGAAAGSEAALVGLEAGRRAALIAELRSRTALRASGTDSPDSSAPFWAVGDAFSSLAEFGSAYKQLRQLLDYRFYFPDRTVMLREELPAPGEPLPAFDLRRFTEEIKREHFAEAFRDLRLYASRMADDHRCAPVGLKSFLGNIIFNLITLLGNMDYDAADLDEAKYGFFRDIEEASDARTAILLLERFLRLAEDKIAEHEGQSGDPNMKKLLAYIEEHYAEPLSLTGLGRHFHFNPSYLSSYFATHNKEGFSEYLNRIRVTKAEELLRTGELSISEISGRVGYSDPGYFTKVFRKQTGFSPSQYRRQHPAGR